jgi:alanine dehydrogenase
MILGGGVVGMNAAMIAAGLGAMVVILDTSLQRLRHLEGIMPPNVNLLYSTRYEIRKHIQDADLVIGAVLVHGAKAPSLILESDLKTMKRGSVIVDVAVDQSGYVEMTRPTTHGDPIYMVHGVIHYGVTNMPGGVPRTSTLALTNATLPCALALADRGWRGACAHDPALALGVNMVDGRVTYSGVAEAFDLEYSDVQTLLTPPAQA